MHQLRSSRSALCPCFMDAPPCCVPMLVPKDTPPSLGCPGALGRPHFLQKGDRVFPAVSEIIFILQGATVPEFSVRPAKCSGILEICPGLSGGLHSSRQHTLMKENVLRLPGLANTQWAPGVMSWKVEHKCFLLTMCLYAELWCVRVQASYTGLWVCSLCMLAVLCMCLCMRVLYVYMCQIPMDACEGVYVCVSCVLVHDCCVYVFSCMHLTVKPCM